MTDALTVLAALKLDDGRRWGDAAELWQWEDARAVLSPDSPSLHWLGRPKGGSKSTDLAGVGIAWLLTQAPPMVEAYVVAADAEQANRLLDKARGFIARTPELAGRITVQRDRIMGPEGARIVALAADVAGSEGLLTPLVLVDELPNWADTPSSRAMWTSVISAVPKWPGMTLAVIGHAGDPAHWSHRIYERAKASTQWRVNDVPGPLPWIRPEDLEEQRHLLLPSQFERRHMNTWVAGEDRLTTVALLKECAVLDGALPAVSGERYVIALDVGLKNDRTAVAVCHAEPVHGPRRRRHLQVIREEPPHLEEWRRRRDVQDGEQLSTTIVLDRMETWQGKRDAPVRLSEVEAWIAEASRAYNGAPVVFDPYQAVGLAQRLSERGIRTREFTFSSASNGRLATTLFTLLRDRALKLPSGDAELLDELANVRLKETNPGVFRLEHDSGKHNDRAVAVAMAAHELLESAPQVVRQSRYSDLRMSGRRAR